jgi:hypothetical protein
MIAIPVSAADHRHSPHECVSGWTAKKPMPRATHQIHIRATAATQNHVSRPDTEITADQELGKRTMTHTACAERDSAANAVSGAGEWLSPVNDTNWARIERRRTPATPCARRQNKRDWWQTWAISLREKVKNLITGSKYGSYGPWKRARKGSERDQRKNLMEKRSTAVERDHITHMIWQTEIASGVIDHP